MYTSYDLIVEIYFLNLKSDIAIGGKLIKMNLREKLSKRSSRENYSTTHAIATYKKDKVTHVQPKSLAFRFFLLHFSVFTFVICCFEEANVKKSLHSPKHCSVL